MTPEQFISQYDEDDKGYAMMKNGEIVCVTIQWCWYDDDEDDRLALVRDDYDEPIDNDQVETVSRERIGGPW